MAMLHEAHMAKQMAQLAVSNLRAFGKTGRGILKAVSKGGDTCAGAGHSTLIAAHF
jgi:hypothetical protein